MCGIMRKKMIPWICEHQTSNLFVFGNFLNAILLRLFTTGAFQLRSIFFDMAVIMLLLGISLIVKKKRRNAYYWIATFLMITTCVTNSLYYNYYSSFISVSLLATSVFVKDVGDAVMEMVIRPCDLTYLWLFVAMFVVRRKHPEEYRVNKITWDRIWISFLICIIKTVKVLQNQNLENLLLDRIFFLL